MEKRYIQMMNRTTISAIERKFLKQLIKNTIKLRGSQYPNPAVGAMVIKDDQMISEGYHHAYGEDHAEVKAIKQAGADIQGSTLLITLEPCIHKGKTPPCSTAIINAKVARVIWAINDPNPIVNGRAAAILVAEGIEVVPHCMPEDAKHCFPEFFTFHSLNRPYVYVKAAMTLDGMISPNSNQLHYISSPESLALVQTLRTYVQAICVGANTINIDQPRLTVRIERSIDFQPMIVILDPRNNIDEAWVKSALDSGRQVTLFRSRPISFNHAGLVVHTFLTSDKTNNWRQVLSLLYEMNIHAVLVEGGSAIFHSILMAGFFDEFWITKVPKIFGPSGIPFISNDQLISLDLQLLSVNSYGPDTVIKYKNNHAFSL